MTQKNLHSSEPGIGDVATSFGALAKCDSSAGAAHEPALALDRDMNTFWASGSFSDAEEHLVPFDINLGNFLYRLLWGQFRYMRYGFREKSPPGCAPHRLGVSCPGLQSAS